MDFKKLKEDAIKMKNKAIQFSSEKLASSWLTIDNNKELDLFIESSANKKFKNKETGEEKTFTKRVFAIFWEEKSDFFKEALYMMPVLISKAFSQNVSLKLVKADSKDVKLKDYWVKDLPAFVV